MIVLEDNKSAIWAYAIAVGIIAFLLNGCAIIGGTINHQFDKTDSKEISFSEFESAKEFKNRKFDCDIFYSERDSISGTCFDSCGLGGLLNKPDYSNCKTILSSQNQNVDTNRIVCLKLKTKSNSGLITGAAIGGALDLAVILFCLYIVHAFSSSEKAI